MGIRITRKAREKKCQKKIFVLLPNHSRRKAGKMFFQKDVKVAWLIAVIEDNGRMHKDFLML